MIIIIRTGSIKSYQLLWDPWGYSALGHYHQFSVSSYTFLGSLTLIMYYHVLIMQAAKLNKENFIIQSIEIVVRQSPTPADNLVGILIPIMDWIMD